MAAIESMYFVAVRPTRLPSFFTRDLKVEEISENSHHTELSFAICISTQVN